MIAYSARAVEMQVDRQPCRSVRQQPFASMIENTATLSILKTRILVVQELRKEEHIDQISPEAPACLLMSQCTSAVKAFVSFT